MSVPNPVPMAREEMSQNERLVLYALVLYPDFNNRLISERTGLKMSTVTAIKNRLLKKGYLTTHIIPNMPMVGCEMATVIWALVDPMGPFDKKLKTMVDMLKDMPECVWAVADPRTVVAILMFRNYTQFHNVGNQTWTAMAEKGLIEASSIHILNFPFQQSGFLRFFEFAPLLKDLYGIDLKEAPGQKTIIGYSGPSKVKLTPVERKVLLGILKNPELLDSNISDTIGVTRQSVTKIRRKLEAMGLIRTLRVPDLKMLNLEIIVGTFDSVARETAARPTGDRMKLFESYKVSRFFLAMASGMEVNLMSVFKDFRAFQIGTADSMGFFKKIGVLKGIPELRLLSISEMRVIKNHDYAPLVEKNLPET